jgi:hypothetical protein
MANAADLAKRWVAIARKAQPTITVAGGTVTITQGGTRVTLPLGKPTVNSTNNVRSR